MSSSAQGVGSLRYFLDPDYRKDQERYGLDSVGFGGGLSTFLEALGMRSEAKLDRDFVRAAEDFMRMNMAPQQKHMAFHGTQTVSKCVSATLFTQTLQMFRELINEISKVGGEELGKLRDEGQCRRSGAGGIHREPACTIGVLDAHTTGSFKTVHVHWHEMLLNWVATAEREFGAMGDSGTVFRNKEVVHATFQKVVSDVFIKRGIATELSPCGRFTQIAGIPDAVRKELSVDKERILESLGKAVKDGDPRAMQWAITAMKRKASGVEVGHTEMREAVVLALKKHGLDVHKFIVPELARPKAGEPLSEQDLTRQHKFQARDVVKAAVEILVARQGFFSKEDFRAQSLLGSIGKQVDGKPLPTKLVEAFVERAMNNEKLLGLKKVVFSDHVRYISEDRPKSEEVLKRAFPGKLFERVTETLEKGGKRVTSTILKAKDIAVEAATTVKDGAKALGAAALAKVVTPKVPPPRIELPIEQVNKFLRQHLPRGKRESLWKAFVRGRTLPAQTMAQKLAIIRSLYASYRRPDRLEKGTVVVVRDGHLLDDRSRDLLKRITKRDGAHLETPGGEGPKLSPKQESKKEQEQQKQQKQQSASYEFRGEGRQRRETPEQ